MVCNKGSTDWQNQTHTMNLKSQSETNLLKTFNCDMRNGTQSVFGYQPLRFCCCSSTCWREVEMTKHHTDMLQLWKELEIKICLNPSSDKLVWIIDNEQALFTENMLMCHNRKITGVNNNINNGRPEQLWCY